MPEGFYAPDDERTLKTVLEMAMADASAPKDADGGLEPAFRHLLVQIVRFATGEDRHWDEPQDLLERARRAWGAAEIRARNESLINLTHEPGADWREARLVLEITTDDRPFIVDSISGALADAGKPVSSFVNAVVDVRRDTEGARAAARGGAGETVRESMIYAEMDPPVDDAEIDYLYSEIQRIFDDVTMAVDDWEPMRARLARCIAQLERSQPPGADREMFRESIEFLKWLWDNRLAFLGARRYDYDSATGKFEHDQSLDLGIARDGSKRILKSTYTESGDLSPAVRDFIDSPEPVLIAKANAKSIVHRRVQMDYIGVKSYALDGRVTGEDRFIGLFTADAYNRPASDLPVLRAKVRKVVEGAGFMPGSHNEKALRNILDTYPRDEIFQSDIDALRGIALGILRLFKRPRTKLFLRRDRFDRFVSAIVFVPRDSFSSTVREEIGEMLADAFNGRIASFNPSFGDALLVRVHFIISIEPGAPDGPGIIELTRRCREITRGWSDALLEELREAHGGAAPTGLFARYKNAFDAGYLERQSPLDALADIGALEAMGARAQRAFRRAGDPDHAINLKLYSRGAPMPLSDLIPRLENLGLNVIEEANFSVRTREDDYANGAGAAETTWINDFHAEQKHKRPIVVDAVKPKLEAAFGAVLAGETEDDGFNALVVAAGLDWREAWVLRAAAKYALQTGSPMSQSYIEDTLVRHPDVARALVGVFHARFDPALRRAGGEEDLDARAHAAQAAEDRVRELLEGVDSLDEDRIIRRFLNFFKSVTRTNYYQKGVDGRPRSCIAFKIDPQGLGEIPDPKPFREIFVSGPRVDGVHLRFGPVARGGLRWSDRREDFRTEVLGLVKAQRVKNAVIVPSGAKGGFFPKQLPVDGDRAEIFEEGRRAYQCFIRALLDVTDNIVDGDTRPPADTVIWDDPDPYLVVAADKGTATFSDTANDIATSYGFWLGDAFASGGSAGYDHKAMGITARGAWEAVKRHFREMGKDIQEEPFTAAGVGDMSGDVFGNGMLLSKKIKLVAAFDHRDIFIDPDPDPETSWAERARLFGLARSSWVDYDKALISKGGGVFSRASKSIALSEEARKLLDIKEASATPTDVIRAILKSRVELFWLGGIGTYFKAKGEENWRVGDRANDAIRIDADEMRMRVVGEGANLGLTQEARIAFARKGGRINTDAVDNSAGVDSSDHEVNIKILLAGAIERGDLEPSARDALLKEMTDDVGAHVLKHNYDQTRAITLMCARAASDHDSYARFINTLEQAGRLDRALETLPSDRRLATMRANGEALTRPELSVLTAYAKMHLFDALVASDAPNDPMTERELFDYFPERVREFKDAVAGHRLRREIVATRLANEVVDTCGATFVSRMTEATGASPAEVTLAYEGARRIHDLSRFADAVNALDNKVPASLQADLYLTASELIRSAVYRFLNDADAMGALEADGVKGLVERFKDPIADLRRDMRDVLSPKAADALEAREADWRKAGAPAEIAAEAAMMPALEFASDIVNLSRRTGWDEIPIGMAFFAVGDRFEIAATRVRAQQTTYPQHFERLAVRRLTEELSASQARLAENAARHACALKDAAPDAPTREWVDGLVADWISDFGPAIDRAERFIKDLQLDADMGVGKLTLYVRKIGELVERTAPRP
ncbi:MAG: NAD-glutamate dehydrogenase [Parvularculaceae bacterium]